HRWLPPTATRVNRRCPAGGAYVPVFRTLASNHRPVLPLRKFPRVSGHLRRAPVYVPSPRRNHANTTGARLQDGGSADAAGRVGGGRGGAGGGPGAGGGGGLGHVLRGEVDTGLGALRVGDRRGSGGQWVKAVAGLRERDDLADRVGLGQMLQHAVHAQRDSTVR